MKPNFLIVALCFFIYNVSFSQNESTVYKFKYYVEKKQAYEIKKIDSIAYVNVPAGAVVQEKKTIQIGGKEFSISQSRTIKNDTVFENRINKSNGEPVDNDGYAFIKQVKDTLHVNPWLGNGFDKDKKYYIKLENRGVPKTFTFTGTQISPLTIPFKYRFKVEKKGKETAPDDFLTDINIGAFISHVWGKQTFFYFKNEEEKSPRTRVVNSFGPFITISATKLDSTNTSHSDEPLKKSLNIALISPGIGYQLAAGGIKAGLFLGFDCPLGTTGKKWNYRNRPWVGIGFGVDVGYLSKFK